MFTINDTKAEGLVSFGSGTGSRAAAGNKSRKGASSGARTRAVRAAQARHAQVSGRGKKERTAALQAIQAAAGNRRTSASQLARLTAAHRRLTTISGR